MRSDCLSYETCNTGDWNCVVGVFGYVVTFIVPQFSNIVKEFIRANMVSNSSI